MHILFLNTQNSLRADVSVHVSLAQALDRGKVRVSVATSRFESPGDSAREAFGSIPDVHLQTLDLGRPMLRHPTLGRAPSLLHNLRGAASIGALAAWCRRRNVDVVHVTERPRDELFGMLLARLAGAACVIHSHTAYYPHLPSRAAAVGDWLLRHADAVVGVSEFTARTLREAAQVPAGRVFAVPNAVDADLLWSSAAPGAGQAMRRALGIPATAAVIGSVSRLMPGKDQESLIEAFAALRRTLPDSRLVLAGLAADVAPDGAGDYRDYLVRRVAALGLADSVVFTGFLPHRQMQNLYSSFDIFAHPCLEEPFGLAIVEAMANSVPVVAVGAGGVPEIIRDDIDGLLVPPHAPVALASALNALLSDPPRAARLSRAGRERVLSAFTPAVQAAKMLEVYKVVLARKVARGRVSSQAYA